MILIHRWQSDEDIPCVLLLKVLPSNPDDWLAVSETSLVLNGGCYWEMLTGKESNNTKTVRIRISKDQVFLPVSLHWMFSQINKGAWK
jgi:hypothetical protein